MIGTIQGDQSISFQSMKKKLAQLQDIVQDDPAVDTVVGVTGGRQVNSGFVYISLKPYSQRKITADGVVSRLRGKLGQVAGRAAVPGRRLRPADGRAAEQRDLSIYAAVGRHCGAVTNGRRG